MGSSGPKGRTGLSDRSARSPRRGGGRRGLRLVPEDVLVDLDFVLVDSDPHSGERAEGLREALGRRSDEDQVEMRDRDVVFPYVYSFHDDTMSGGVLRVMLTEEATPCARMARMRNVRVRTRSAS
jgi:hypothetical protein